jgi:BirA family biotin operon repressor/biotin-[acetyl-CoA-carboxylase] ligase
MQTLFIGKNLLFLHEVESTNTYAMNLLRNVNVIEGTIVYTDNQTKGRGQRGTVWSSNIGQNIISSIILKPKFLSIENSFYLSKITALAIYDVLTDILTSGQYDIKIKWPNDILVNQQKIAGILIETNIANTAIKEVVIGIGFNVNQMRFDEFERFATSLRLLTANDFDRELILNLLCEKIEKWYLKLKQQKLAFIDTSYLAVLFGMNKQMPFTDSVGNRFEGKIVGVSNNGKLKIQLSNSVEKECDVKEVKFLI